MSTDQICFLDSLCGPVTEAGSLADFLVFSGFYLAFMIGVFMVGAIFLVLLTASRNIIHACLTIGRDAGR